MARRPPSRKNSRSCSTRRNFAWAAGVISLTSSRNNTPPAANSICPGFARYAPVTAPRSTPNSSDSSSDSGSAAQLIATNGPRPRGEARWMNRATTSFPTLDSPCRHVVASAYEKGPERFLHDSAGFVSCCFAFGDGPDQRVASPGVVCAIRLRRRGSAERRADLRASIEEGAPAPEHHLFLRLSTNGSNAKRRNNLMGRSVVSVFLIERSHNREFSR